MLCLSKQASGSLSPSVAQRAFSRHQRQRGQQPQGGRQRRWLSGAEPWALILAAKPAQQDARPSQSGMAMIMDTPIPANLHGDGSTCCHALGQAINGKGAEKRPGTSQMVSAAADQAAEPHVDADQAPGSQALGEGQYIGSWVHMDWYDFQ